MLEINQIHQTIKATRARSRATTEVNKWIDYFTLKA